MMKQTRIISRLIILLPIGMFVTLFFDSVLRHRYDDRGTGIYYGSVRGRLSNLINQWTQNHFFSLRFKGRTRPQWRWTRPDNYQYEILEIEWDSGETRGKGILDLDTLILTTDTNSFVFSETSLATMLFPNSNANGVEPFADSGIEATYSLLTAAGKGALPRPRHHGFSFEEPLTGGGTHFSLGLRIPYTVYVWLAIWSTIVAFQVARHKKKTKAQGSTARHSTIRH